MPGNKKAKVPIMQEIAQGLLWVTVVGSMVVAGVNCMAGRIEQAQLSALLAILLVMIINHGEKGRNE